MTTRKLAAGWSEANGGVCSRGGCVGGAVWWHLSGHLSCDSPACLEALGVLAQEPDWSKFIPTEEIPIGPPETWYGIREGDVFASWGDGAGIVLRRADRNTAVLLAPAGARVWNQCRVRLIRRANGRWGEGHNEDGAAPEPTPSPAATTNYDRAQQLVRLHLGRGDDVSVLAGALDAAEASGARSRDAEVAALREELRLANVLLSPKLTAIEITKGGFEARIDGKGVMQVFAAAFWDLLVETGAKNFLQVTFDRADRRGDLMVTLQRKDGKTPAELKEAAEAEVAALAREVEEAAGLLGTRPRAWERGEVDDWLTRHRARRAT